MTHDEKTDDLILSTGKRLHPNSGILGLKFKQGDSTLYGGYDSYDVDETPDPADDAERITLTPAERREIAAAMIERWKDWAELPIYPWATSE